MLVNDQYQGRGLGSELLRSLITIGQAEELDRISADILSENRAMQHLCKKLGFTVHREHGEIRAVLDL